MLYRVRHETHYQYSKPVSLGHNLVSLVPRTSLHQTCVRYHLEVTPVPAVLSRHLDSYGNDVVYFAVQDLHRTLDVVMTSTVDVLAPGTPWPEATLPWERVADGVRSNGHLDAFQFVFDSTHVAPLDAMTAYTRESFTAGRPILDAALDLTHRVYRDFRYDPHFSTIGTPLGELFAARRGVCQDFAHLMLAGLRSLQLPARYVSGYLQTSPPPGRPRLVGSDASHAWISIYCLEDGWVDLDPTNDLIPGERHLTLGWGRDYADVSPIRGVVLGGGDHAMHTSVDVAPISDPGPPPETQLMLTMTEDSV